MHASSASIRHPLTLALWLTLWLPLLALLLAGQGCRTFGRSGNRDQESLTLTLRLDKGAYLPGEAAEAIAELANTGARPLRVRALDPASVEFAFGREGQPERMLRRAVTSRDEPLQAMIDLAPGQSVRRTFVLTRLTEYEAPGAFATQAHYTPAALNAGQAVPVKVYSNPVQFTVQGRRRLERDPEGIITQAQAIRLARAAARGDISDAQAILVLDEKGFFKWYVNVIVTGARAVGYLVDPYFGTVLAKAEPFDPKLAEDPRFRRPANLPPMPLPGTTLQPGAVAGPQPASSRAPRLRNQTP